MGGLARYMKLSALSMLLAGLSLSGIPPFAGFWSKDTILDVAHEAGATIPWLLGVITAFLTAAYTFRMIIMVFYYKPSRHVEEHAEHVHEAHPLMLIPYFTLALLSLLIGLAWPWIEGKLTSLIPGATLALEGESLHVAINMPLMATSVSLALLGLGIAVYIYQVKLMRPYDYVVRSPSLMKLHGFLYDRWYLNSIYYWIFVRGGEWFADTLYKYVNNALVDSFYHRFLPWFFMSSARGLYATSERAIDVGFHVKLVDGVLAASRRVRRMQTGVLNHYVLTMWLGLAVLILIVIWYVGWII
jgi:NADH-quinone oxidoreductase subunit L